MTSILTSISGQFSKVLILGTFFPAAVFVIFGMIFAVPLFPAEFPLLKPLEALGTEWVVVFLAFLTLVLSGLLYNLNIPIIRMYEGYPWLNSWVGEHSASHQRTRFKAAEARNAGMQEVIDYLKEQGTDAEDVRAVEGMRPRIGQRVNYEFPGRESLVLPTRLGNIIRSFEFYPSRQYGMSSIALWPRLVAKVDKDYAAAIDDTKSSFDFMINSSVLSTVLSFVILVTGLSYPSSMGSQADWLWWLVEVAAFLALAYLLYRGSISRASAWGSMVKGAFDLYRWDLLKQLGYERAPKTVPEEHTFWDTVSRQIIYGYAPKDKGRPADYGSVSAFARGKPPGASLEVGRGLSRPAADDTATVTLRVKNTDTTCVVKDLVVTDTTSEGSAYLWGSARVDAQDIPVLGTNPYHFEIGARVLAPGEELLLTYTVIPHKG